jgi:hypothetical protein
VLRNYSNIAATKTEHKTHNQPNAKASFILRILSEEMKATKKNKDKYN